MPDTEPRLFYYLRNKPEPLNPCLIVFCCFVVYYVAHVFGSVHFTRLAEVLR
ncbi:MAG TPA: hypothetical protein VGG64_22345 [Pirellulales bacterium]